MHNNRITAALAPENCSGVVLAGGEGSRMGGVDKGLLAPQGEAVVTLLLRQLQPQVSDLLVVVNRHLEIYQQQAAPFNARVITDLQPGFHGPLMGMASAMQAATSDYLLFTPCDNWQLPPHYATRMFAALKAQQATIAVARNSEGPQRIHALLPRKLLEDLLAFLARGERAVGIWYRQHHTIEVDFSDAESALVNRNHPAEWQAAADTLH
ncbi:MAG: molybdenum cofactor guanylyltransferase [Gammaproteobacteria bacterium]|nr:molybdenum cofactor guanylyltransferase [Gammaproteobacteria bacterium]